MSRATPITTILPNHPIATVDPYRGLDNSTPISKLAPQSVTMGNAYQQRNDATLLNDPDLSTDDSGRYNAIVDVFSKTIPKIAFADKEALQSVLGPLASILKVPATTLTQSTLEQQAFNAATASDGVLNSVTTVRTTQLTVESDGTETLVTSTDTVKDSSSVQTLMQLLSALEDSRSQWCVDITAHVKALAALAGVAMMSGVSSMLPIIRSHVDAVALADYDKLCVWNAAMAGDAESLLGMLTPDNYTSYLAMYPDLWITWCAHYAGQYRHNEAIGRTKFNQLFAYLAVGSNELQWLTSASAELLDFLTRHAVYRGPAYGVINRRANLPVTNYVPASSYIF